MPSTQSAPPSTRAWRRFFLAKATRSLSGGRARSRHSRRRRRGARQPRGLFQGFDEKQNFGGHRVVQIRSLGEAWVAAAGDDDLEGVGEGQHRAMRIGTLREFLEEGRRPRDLSAKQELGGGEGEAAIRVVVLSAVAAVGKVAGDCLAFRLCGGGGAGVCLDIGKDGPCLPWIERVARLCGGSRMERRWVSYMISAWYLRAFPAVIGAMAGESRFRTNFH